MKRQMIPFLAILSILLIPFSSLAQNTTQKGNHEQIRTNSASFTILCPNFLSSYVKDLYTDAKKNHTGLSFRLINANPFDTFSNFEKGQADIAFGFNPFPEKRSTRKIEVLKNPSGQDILSIQIGKTGLMILTHRANPLKGLTLFQADAIFSSERKCGYPFNITKWGQLGLSGAWIEQPVHLMGLTRQSFAAKLFQQMVLCGGSIKSDFREQIDNSDVIAQVSADKRAIGFCTLSQNLQQAKTVPVAAREGSNYILPSEKNILSGMYPLTKTIFLFVRLPNNKALPSWKKLLIKKALDTNGQTSLGKYGAIPIYPEGFKRDINYLFKEAVTGRKKGKDHIT